MNALSPCVPAPPLRHPEGPFDDPIRNALHALPRHEAEKIYADAFRRNDKEAMRWLVRNDRYFLLTCVLGRADARNDWLYARCREVEADPDDHLDLWARDHYKAQQVQTLTPTPTGWKKHGDLEPGDWVFGANGTPCRVVARTKVFTDADCYEIAFDDGTKNVCSGDHIWRVERRTRKRIPMAYNKPGPKRLYRETVLMTTREIAAHDHRQDRRLMIKNAESLILPQADLPIAPYVLGCWLGDGAAVNGTVACGDDIWSEITKTDIISHNHTPQEKHAVHTVFGLLPRLRALAVLGDKHIPDTYLRASVDQRLALLQGLMDTDGHCDTRGTATFVNINERLTRQVYELVASLGMKPHLRSVNGKHNGEPYPYVQLSFQAHRDMAPFRLPRKLARCLAVKRGRSAGRFIVSCEPTETTPVSCIQVDSPDGMYLVGQAMIPTHNSTIITLCGIIQEIMRDPEITICIFSNNKPTAKKFLRQIKTEFEGNKFLKWLFPDILWEEPKKQAQTWGEDSGLVVRRKSNPKEATLECSGLLDGMETGSHFVLRVYDDIVDETTVTSAEMIRKVTYQWELSDNLGRRDGRSWHIGTRYHFGDTYGIIIKRGVIKERRYPATADGTFDGSPVFLTQKQWDRKKANASKSTIAAQQLLNPLAGSETKFDVRWLKFWLIRPKSLNVYIMGDPSKGKNSTSDNTAFAVVGVDVHLNKYLLDGFRHRMPLSKRWETLKNLYKRWSRTPGIETVIVGYEQFGLQTDLEYFEEKMRVEEFSFPIEELAWPNSGPKSKEGRIERLEPDFRMGRFKLPAIIEIDDEGNVLPVDPSRKKLAVQYAKDGQGYRVARPIRHRDEDDRVYDVVMGLLEEYSFHPFAPYNDLLDAISRIYDMEISAPVFYEQESGRPMSLEPQIFPDT